MKFLIDDANIDIIKDIYEYYPIDGVTTNPTILAKSGGTPYKVLKEIREFIGEGAELHVQVISRDTEGIVAEGKKIVEELGQNTYVKIPLIPEGLKAIKILTAQGYKVTATSIYTPLQAYLAAKAGAHYAAPYVNRIDNLGVNGIASVKIMQDIIDKNGLKTKLLAASFKNSQQIQELCEYGIGAATVGSDVIYNLIRNAYVEDAVDAFIEDFEGICGKGKTMLDCE